MWSRAPSRLRDLLRQPTCTYQDSYRSRRSSLSGDLPFSPGRRLKRRTLHWNGGGARERSASAEIRPYRDAAARFTASAFVCRENDGGNRQASDEQATAGRDRHSVMSPLDHWRNCRHLRNSWKRSPESTPVG